MWLRQSLFNAIDTDGNEVFLDVDDFGRHWLMVRVKSDNGNITYPVQSCRRQEAIDILNSFVESQNTAERNFHFMQGATAWRY